MSVDIDLGPDLDLDNKIIFLEIHYVRNFIWILYFSFSFTTSNASLVLVLLEKEKEG